MIFILNVSHFNSWLHLQTLCPRSTSQTLILVQHVKIILIFDWKTTEQAGEVREQFNVKNAYLEWKSTNLKIL
jgi:hypothetical protein